MEKRKGGKVTDYQKKVLEAVCEFIREVEPEDSDNVTMVSIDGVLCDGPCLIETITDEFLSEDD